LQRESFIQKVHLQDYVRYGNTSCGVFQAAGTRLETFFHKNQHTQRKLLSFEFWINSELSKIGRHFSNKKISNMIYQKMSITKDRCAPKLVFFNKKMRGIQMIFEIEN
jgi:hypothetical protein